MLDFSGIIYRLCVQCSITLILGLALLIVFGIKKQCSNKEAVAVGVLLVGMSLYYGIYYFSCIRNPDIHSVQVTFSEEYRYSRIAGLPFIMEYRFAEEDGDSCFLYLDTFSKKDIFPDKLIKGQEYLVYYEDKSDIILGIEVIDP